jgi:DNA-directed RNA polymerase beta subunit
MEKIQLCNYVFNGYNVEDSILFNEGSVKRGLFRTTYFSFMKP